MILNVYLLSDLSIKTLSKNSAAKWLIHSNGKIQKINSTKGEQPKWHTEVIPDYQKETAY